VPTRPVTRCLSVALALACVTSQALGQLNLTPRRSLIATPQRAILGTAITLSVRGAAQGATYRYVAAVTGSVPAAPKGKTSNCNATVTIGSGTSVKWQPGSGSYRLTAYGPVGRETDTLTLAYVVPPRRVMLASAELPGPGDSVRLLLRTDDLGPGHVYEWWMRVRLPPPSTGGGPGSPHPPATWSPPWTTQTSGAMATYPKALVRPPLRIEATVEIHRGNVCEIIAAGAMPSQ
jgi:hypothetical protein